MQPPALGLDLSPLPNDLGTVLASLARRPPWLTFQVARDSSSAIERAEYSLDGGDWTVVYPVGRLSDFPRESYEFTLTNLAPGEHTVAVRVFDSFQNGASAKTTFHSSS